MGVELAGGLTFTKRQRRPKGKGGKAKTPQARRVGLSMREVLKLKTRLRGSDENGRRLAPETTDERGRPVRRTFHPSAPWIDASFFETLDHGPDGEAIVYCFHNADALPRGMVRCRRCGHATPPNCASARGVCLDCQYGAMSKMQLARMPGSASKVNLAKVKSAVRRGENPTGGI